MFNIFKRKKTEQQPEDLAWLYADMHGHFIPGIDDGPKELEQSLKLLESMVAFGYKKLVTTPHINADFFPNTPEIIAGALASLQHAVAERGIDIEISAAAEYMIDFGFMDLLDAPAPLLTLGNTNHVLVEMGYMQEVPMLDNALFRVQAKGYVPVLAHPERYVFYHDAPLSLFENLKEKGCLLQLNVIALAGYYGKEVLHAAERLLNAGLYDYCGSDVHHERHIKALTMLLNSKNYPKIKHGNFLNASL
ncbi:tyrosine-protein phosphatase [Taibaiella chishuiensis]|uniref:protein-tyrosine-phosphatase n=1 Tax=Taibaiella chishuiensis TaxID=1434707 RepID=A0A2P8D2M3_9BACT|nr:CpsB/CapC family capsule biosynthesis tyrosine phosphatase [Taibaiella chishuiensis]PSK91465.1 tyrosine-protein phosphatase YwqE [Taibaiella chishuiensis]